MYDVARVTGWFRVAMHDAMSFTFSDPLARQQLSMAQPSNAVTQ
jgi:hypothetical protein